MASTHYPHGVHATVTSHPLNADGSVYVPPDPQVVSWASNEAAVGSDRGTAIIAGHVNYVINGRLVIGALADLAQYARQSVGAIITVHTRDGGELNYRITAGREYNKNLLAANSRLRASLFDQTSVFGVASHPTGRLLLVSCGGNFDPATGEYDDNVFLYALPVG